VAMKLLEHQPSIMLEHHAQITAEQCPTNGRTHLRKNYSPYVGNYLFRIARRGAERIDLSRQGIPPASASRSAAAAKGMGRV